MTVPTKDKTWQFDINQTFKWPGSQALAARQIVLAIKNSLIGFGTQPWEVVGSCDAVTAGLDASDRWVDVDDVVQAADAVAHSWIVLKQTGLGSNFQILIDMSTTPVGTTGGRVMVSPNAGFTGGTTIARPTATDEYGPLSLTSGSASMWGTQSWYTVTSQLHVMQSTDGECTRILLYTGDPASALGPVCMLFGIFDKLKNPVTGFTIPVVCGWLGQSGMGNVLTQSNLMNITAGAESFRSYHSASAMRGAMTCDGLTNPFFTYMFGVNQASSEYPMLPAGFYVPNTTLRRGRHGQFYDLWFGANLPHGYSYPSNSALDFVQFGQIILPWDGSSFPLLS